MACLPSNEPSFDELLKAVLQLRAASPDMTAKVVHTQLLLHWSNLALSDVKRACSKATKRSAHAVALEAAEKEAAPSTMLGLAEQSELPIQRTPEELQHLDTKCQLCKTHVKRSDVKNCEKCAHNRTATWYCSKECQGRDWPRHKVWHQMDKKTKAAREGFYSARAEVGLDTPQTQLAVLPQGSSRYDKLCAEAATLLRKRDHTQARKVAIKAVKLEPNKPEAHSHLGNVDQMMGGFSTAIKCWSKAMACSERATIPWARAALSTFMLVVFTAGSDPKLDYESIPSWMRTMVELKHFAQDLLIAVPHMTEAWAVSATVLVGSSNPEDQKLSGEHFLRGIELTETAAHFGEYLALHKRLKDGDKCGPGLPICCSQYGHAWLGLQEVDDFSFLDPNDPNEAETLAEVAAGYIASLGT